MVFLLPAKILQCFQILAVLPNGSEEGYLEEEVLLYFFNGKKLLFMESLTCPVLCLSTVIMGCLQ